MGQDIASPAVDISAFVRRLMVAEQGQLFVTLDAGAPTLQLQDAVRLIQWENREMLVERIMPSTRGWTLLLQQFVAP